MRTLEEMVVQVRRLIRDTDEQEYPNVSDDPLVINEQILIKMEEASNELWDLLIRDERGENILRTAQAPQKFKPSIERYPLPEDTWELSEVQTRSRQIFFAEKRTQPPVIVPTPNNWMAITDGSFRVFADDYLKDIVDIDFRGDITLTEEAILTYVGDDTVSAAFSDSGQDFTPIGTAAPGTAAFLIMITNTDDSLTWGYCGDVTGGTLVDIYTNVALTIRGFQGALPFAGGLTPLSYVVVPVIDMNGIAQIIEDAWSEQTNSEYSVTFDSSNDQFVFEAYNSIGDLNVAITGFDVSGPDWINGRPGTIDPTVNLNAREFFPIQLRDEEFLNLRSGNSVFFGGSALAGVPGSLGWHPTIDGFIKIFPRPVQSVDLYRVIYYRKPAFPSSNDDEFFNVPDGIDELVEFLTSVKLKTDKIEADGALVPIQAFTSFFNNKLETFLAGRGGGLVRPDRRYVAVVERYDDARVFAGTNTFRR